MVIWCVVRVNVKTPTLETSASVIRPHNRVLSPARTMLQGVYVEVQTMDDVSVASASVSHPKQSTSDTVITASAVTMSVHVTRRMISALTMVTVTVESVTVTRTVMVF